MHDKTMRLTDLLQEMKTARSREQADDVLLRVLSLLTTNSTDHTIRQIKQAYQRAVVRGVEVVSVVAGPVKGCSACESLFREVETLSTTQLFNDADEAGARYEQHRRTHTETGETDAGRTLSPSA